MNNNVSKYFEELIELAAEHGNPNCYKLVGGKPQVAVRPTVDENGKEVLALILPFEVEQITNVFQTEKIKEVKDVTHDGNETLH